MKKLTLTLLMISLLFGCKVIKDDDDIIDDEDDIVETDDDIVDNERVINSQYDTWEKDALAGVMFIGYGDYYEFENYIKTKDFIVISNLYPDIDAIHKVQTNNGDIMLFMISRYEDTKVLIKDQDDNILLEEDFFDALLIRTNESELRPEIKIILEYKDQIVEYEPILSMMDSHLEPQKGIMDLSLYLNYYGLEGDFENDDMQIHIDFFEDLLIFNDKRNNVIYEGSVLFESPIDFREDFDDSEYLLYFNLYGDSERYQLFSKFLYSMPDEDTLLLIHFSYDPLFKNEDYKTYTLKRK